MITIIVAATPQLAIGAKGDLLFHISADLRRFKALTMGCPIIMGRRTFESFPKGALPGRRNIVVTRNGAYSAPNIETAPSIEEAVAMCHDAEHIFIIGGGEIYRQAIGMADTIELTLIEAECPEADTFFPPIDPALWEASEGHLEHDPKSGVGYRFVSLTRRR